jgi:hypothetical protein
VTLVEERVLSNPQRQGAWSQTYGETGWGSLVIAQSATHGRALGGAGLAPAAPEDAPATLEASEPIRSGVVRQLVDGVLLEITVAVYRELPNGLVDDAALVWRVDDTSYAMRYRGEQAVLIDDLTEIAWSMQTV